MFLQKKNNTCESNMFSPFNQMLLKNENVLNSLSAT